MDLDLFKYLSALFIWIGSLIGALLPIKLKAAKWVSRAEALAGGVFLGAGLAHLLHESMEDLGKSIDTHYPTSPAICLGTFVLLSAVELFTYGEHDAEFEIQTRKEELLSSLLDGSPSIAEDSYAQVSPTSFGTTYCTLPTISLYIIMDIHSVIEGMAVGIGKNFNQTLALFFAIIGHKPVEAFALGLILLKDRPKKWFYFLLIGIYTIVTPIGIIFTIWLKKHSSEVVQGCIGAFSAGTFLFVGAHEWAEMFEHKTEWGCGEKSWHYWMFVLGVVWMLAIALIEALA